MARSEPARGTPGAVGDRSKRAIRGTVEPLVVAGLGAHTAAVGLATFTAQPPLLTAVVATVVFAGISLAYARSQRGAVGPDSAPLPLAIQADGVVLVVTAAGVWLLARFLGTGREFYCDPLVPWRIEIAVLGSAGLGYITSMARLRRRADIVYPVVLLALVSFAPFYGFFSAPLFLGVSLNAMCPARPSVGVLLAAVGMRAGERIGLAAVSWLSGANATGRGR